jgi:O-antigen ligase
VAAVLGAVFLFVIWPRLEALTGGAIGERFSSTSSSGRDLLIQADLKTWSENPIFGAGPGLGAKNRIEFFKSAAAHTEYSRMLAEHGLLGLMSLVTLGLMAAASIRGSTRLEKTLAAALLVYSLLQMTVDGMRLAAPGFAFGLAAARLVVPRRQAAAQPAERIRLAVGA